MDVTRTSPRSIVLPKVVVSGNKVLGDCRPDNGDKAGANIVTEMELFPLPMLVMWSTMKQMTEVGKRFFFQIQDLVWV